MLHNHALQRRVGKQIVALMSIFAAYGALAACGTPLRALAQSGRASLPVKPANLDFENSSGRSGFPKGWGGGGEGYRLETDTEGAHSGKACGRIRFVEGSGEGFGTFTQAIAPDAYRGKRVRYTGWLKAQGVNEGWGGMWMRVDGPNHQVLAFDNMQDRPVKGTIGWQRCTVTLDVPKEAVDICFGFLLAGKGTLWGDDLRLEAIGPAQSGASARLGSASLPAEPANPDFESGRGPGGRPVGWGGGGEGYRLELDTEGAHSGKGCGRIRFVEGSGEGFGTFTQAVAPDAYRGKRVRYTGWLKAQDVNEGWGGMWMRVDGSVQGQALAFDNMEDRPVKGTTGWQRCTITLDVPKEATAIYFGFLLAGKGTLWGDDFHLEVVGPTP